MLDIAVVVALLVIIVRPRRWRVTLLLLLLLFKAAIGKQTLDATNAKDASAAPGVGVGIVQCRALVVVLRCCIKIGE